MMSSAVRAYLTPPLGKPAAVAIVCNAWESLGQPQAEYLVSDIKVIC